MAVFAAAAAIVKFIGIKSAAVALVAKSVIGGALAFGVSRLIAPRARQPDQVQSQTGGRVQLPPATNNKLPVLYGKAFMTPIITDAMISTDNQTMWYVLPITEVTGNGGQVSFGRIYYNGNLVQLSGSSVTSLTNNAGEVDARINGKIQIYLFPNGSSSGINTGGQSAIQLLSDPRISPANRWNGPRYTENGQSPTMNNVAFMIVRMDFDQDAGTTSLGNFTIEVTNSLTNPGIVFRDYMENERYGCAIPLSQIDIDSLLALDQYAAQPVNFISDSGQPTSQPRYRINGPLDTNNSCLQNLQKLADACDSWIQFDEINGRWKIIPNKGFNEFPNQQNINQLFRITDDNLIEGITITPTELNGTYNQVEVQYPNENIRDQFDFVFIDLRDELPDIVNNNEPPNKLNIRSEVINNFVQAKFIGIRRLLQSREDLIIDMVCDHSCMVINAGDVIRIDHAEYGWINKLFRVSNVTEEENIEGRLVVRIGAFEYSPSIYDNNIDITDFVPSMNTGLTDPNIFGEVDAPVVEVDETGTIRVIRVSVTVPTTGLIRFMDLNYGISADESTHILFRRLSNSDGSPLTPGQTFTTEINDLPISGEVFFSVTARNGVRGSRSASSNSVFFEGIGLTNWDFLTGTGGIRAENIPPNIVTPEMLTFPVNDIAVVDTLPVCSPTTEGTIVYLTTDRKLYECDGSQFRPVVRADILDGQIIADQIDTVFANSVFGSLTNSVIDSQNLIGEIVGNQIADAAITNEKIAANTIIGDRLVANTITANQIAAGTITSAQIASRSILADNIVAGTLTGVEIAANSINGNRITAGTLAADRIIAGSISAAQIGANAIGTTQLIANSVTADKLLVNTLSSVSANVGIITAGVIRNANDTFNTNLNTGRTIIRTGTSGAFMKVSGAPFGSSNQFIEWYGPFFTNLANCTESNAVYYLKTDGSAFFGGSLRAGTFRNASQTTSIDPGASVSTETFASNGGTRDVVVTYLWSANEQIFGACPVLNNPTATIRLRRGTTILQTWNVTGSVTCQPGFNQFEPGSINSQMGQSWTITDNSGGTSVEYNAQIISRSVPITSNMQQSLGIVSTEQ